MQTDLRQLRGELMQSDPDRAIASLFAGKRGGGALLLLAAFDRELGRIPARTGEFLIRRMRYQFFRDALEGKPGEGGEHPLIAALRGHFESDIGAFEIFQQIIDRHQQAAEEQISSDDWPAQRQALLFESGCRLLSRDEADKPSAEDFADCGALYHAVRSLHAGLKADHQQREQIEELNRSLSRRLDATARLIRPALLPLALVSPYLQLSKGAYAETGGASDLSPLSRVWRMWRAMRRGFR